MPGMSSSRMESEEPTYTLPSWCVANDIVVSGMSGRFPESANVEELQKNLYDQVDMVTEDDRRWPSGLYGTPKGLGKIPDLETFDAWFFSVHGRMAASMDPAQRILLEVAYEAIFDAGIDPMSLAGRDVGVFVGSSGAATPEVQSELDDLLTGYETLGNSPAMLSNRTSYTFDFKGPSFTLDTGCSSSIYAMAEAVLAMRAGQCEAAVVAGSTLLLKFYSTAQLNNVGILSCDSRCRAFDSTANGFVRSESICAVYLQKASDAKRCYGTVLNIKTRNDGRKAEGIMFPSAPCQSELLKACYDEIELDPRRIAYLESHGTGNLKGDIEEGKVIGDIFCPEKEDTILVSSTKSNMGHTESSSGVVSVIKVMLSFETGVIPANLHFRTPNPKIKCLMDGRMKVVDKNTPFKGGIVGITNNGFGGGSAHMVIKSFNKERSEPANGRQVPRLVLSCGCSVQGVKYILDTVRERNFNDEGVALLEEACKTTPERMRFRGYTLLGNEGAEENVIQGCKDEPRPVWFLYSGMGSQWAGMAKQMMRLKPFAKSIRESAEILRPFGIDLIHLLTDASEEELNLIVYPFVTIAAVQIALTELLWTMGIKADGIVGHSVGELGCAFADGGFSAKQMLLASYWRGKSCVSTELIDGKMAAVGMTWEEAKRRCPPGVFAVCHNAQDSVTISGPTEQVEKFIEQLKSENIFAKAVKTGDIAFHSKYVIPASIIMRKELEKVIPNPTERSPIWVSSSVPEEDWHKPEAKLSSVDYHINNLLSPVLFNEAMSKVPKNALIIEIAPHSLLAPIVKRILGPQALYVGLINKNKKDTLRGFLSSIGDLYNAGLNPSARHLYDPVTFPVPRGTPMLNSLIKWDGTPWQTWSFKYGQIKKDMVTIDTIKGGPYEYIVDHRIDGRVLFTAAGYVHLVWKALAKQLQVEMEELPVIFEDFTLHRACVMPKSGIFVFNVKVLESEGVFSILEGGSTVVSGKIRKDTSKNPDNAIPELVQASSNPDADVFTMDAESFYMELRLRGYEYSKSYQGVTRAQSDGRQGIVQWKDNWVTFLESTLQIALLQQSQRALVLPTRIGYIRLDPFKKPRNFGEELPVTYNPFTTRFESGPVEVQNMNLVLAPRRMLKFGNVVQEEYKFVPFFDNNALTSEEEAVLEDYSLVCYTLASNILVQKGNFTNPGSHMKQANESMIRKYLMYQDKRFALLHMLEKCYSSSDYNLDVAKYSLSKDYLVSACLSERSARACLDCFLDNTVATKLNILEISGNNIIYPEVDRMLRLTFYGHLTLNYNLAKVNTQSALPSDLSPSANLLDVKVNNLSFAVDQDLVVAKDLFTDNVLPLRQTMQAIASSVKDNGFVMICERTAITLAEDLLQKFTGGKKVVVGEHSLENAFKEANLVVVAKKKDRGTFVTYLLRKISDNVTKDRKVVRVTEDSSYVWIEDLKNLMKKEDKPGVLQSVWVVDERPQTGISGMINSLFREIGGKRLRVYCNASLEASDKPPRFDQTDSQIEELMNKDLRTNCYRNGQWGMFVSQEIAKEVRSIASNKCYLDVLDRGDLSSLRWIAAEPDEEVVRDGQVQVVCSALNYRDVMVATGKIPISVDSVSDGTSSKGCRIGLEYAGVEEGTGRRVIGVVQSRGLSNKVTGHRDLTFEIPPQWSMEEASTVPLAYLTAIHALLVKGRIEEGDAVLVHSGAGGVGQAAITIALAHGCNVFTTVGTEEKKRYLLRNFPGLEGSNILNSRTEDFGDQILNLTSGQGVDIVLNSLSSEKLKASVRCLKASGRFLEIGMQDAVKNNPLGLSPLTKNVEIHGINMSSLLEPRYHRKLVPAANLLRQSIQKGIVKPLNRTVFTWQEVKEAFRLIEGGEHIGKIVIKIRDDGNRSSGGPLRDYPLPALPRLHFSSTKSVVVTGGLGGVGFELVHWLVEKGARKILLSTRSGIKNTYQRLWFQKWAKSGVQVKISQKDIATDQGCRALLKEAAEMGPVGAIFHLAVVLRDGLLENLKAEDYVAVSRPKVEGTRRLDVCSRELCPDLEHFVVSSSIIGAKSVAGVGNYCYCNNVMERIVEHRRQQGLPGQAIQFGVISDVGIIYKEFGDNSTRVYDTRGSIMQSPAASFMAVERFILDNKPVMSFFVRQDEEDSEGGSRKDLLAMVGNILGIKDVSILRPEATLGSLGMDSLMVVETKQLLETDYNTSLAVPEVLKLTIQRIQEISKEADAAQE